MYWTTERQHDQFLLLGLSMPNPEETAEERQAKGLRMRDIFARSQLGETVVLSGAIQAENLVIYETQPSLIIETSDDGLVVQPSGGEPVTLLYESVRLPGPKVRILGQVESTAD